MKKHCLLLLTSLILWACDDGNSTGGAIIVDEVETSSSEESSSSIESSSSEIRSSSSIAPSSSSKAKSSSSSKVRSSSSSKKKSSSSSKAKSSSSNAAGQSSISSNEVSSSSGQSSSSATGSSSSTPPYYVEVSPIVLSPITVNHNADKSEFTFSGRAYLDENVNTWQTTEPFFTDMYLVLAHVNKFNQNVQPLIELQYTKPPFPTSTIDLGAMGVKISDPEKNQCGTFKLFIVLNASNDPEMNDRYIAVDSLEFVREPEYCQTKPTSSSAAEIINPRIELTKYRGSMSTSITKGFSFKDNAEVPVARAQIQVTENKDGDLTLHGVNGYKVAKYDNTNDRNWDDDWSSMFLPPSPAHTGDFRFTEASLADSVKFFDIDFFWVVIGPAFNDKTGDDFYTITLRTKERPDADGIRQLEIIYYKK